MIFTGSAVALVTPFNEDNTPNFEKIKEKRKIKYLLFAKI